MRKLACHAYGLQHINKKKARGEMTSDKADRGLNPNLVHNPNPNRKSPMNLNPTPGRYFNGVSCPDHFTIHD